MVLCSSNEDGGWIELDNGHPQDRRSREVCKRTPIDLSKVMGKAPIKAMCDLNYMDLT